LGELVRNNVVAEVGARYEIGEFQGVRHRMLYKEKRLISVPPLSGEQQDKVRS
jgi:hypothetical protein